MKFIKTSLLVFCLTGSHLAGAFEPLVIVLSWDGMRHDFPDLGTYPGLQKLEKQGIRAEALIPVYPSNTFPGHLTLATGAEPEVHGIVDNKFLDRKKGSYSYGGDARWIDAEPIWIAAERQGIRSAIYFWVGSATDWRGQASTYRVTPFDGNIPEADKVNKIIAWLDLAAAERPQLIMSYWRGADAVAHKYGPNHNKVSEVIGTQDKQLRRLLNAIDARRLWHRTTLILVSDHGMTEVYKSAEIKTALADSGISSRVFGGSSLQHVFVDDAAHIDAVYELLSKQPNVKAYRGNNLPDRFHFAHPDRTGDIIVTVEPPFTLNRPESLKDKAIKIISRLSGRSKGGHGYNPRLADMQGIFYAMGRGVDANKSLGKVYQLDVAPTIANLLGINPPRQSSGAAIALD